MKIIPNYKKCAFIVPGAALDALDRADKFDLAVLLYALAKEDFDPASAATELGIGENDFHAAISFWEERGIMAVAKRKGSSGKKTSEGARDSKVTAPVKSTKKTAQRSTIPSYTTEETASFLENNKIAAGLIDSCENIIGKIFTTAETGIVIGMMDHLSLSSDYILLLFAHARNMGKQSVRYVEKLAISFVDRDITTYPMLEAELSELQLTEDTVKAVRRLFGLGSRALIAREKEMIRDWCITWNYTVEIIELAYEITVKNTREASLSYANAIMESWHKDGLSTIEQIKEMLAERDKKKQQKSESTSSSFETEDFFDAALRRSYGED